MKTNKLSGLFAIVLLAFFCISCSDDDNGNNGSGGPTPGSREVRYEISGNFTGQLTVVYMAASGGTTSESITLPWSKNITYGPSVAYASLNLVGAGGVAGQTATIKLIAGGNEKSTTPATATANGTITGSAPAYAFN